nr:DEAD/DEAH box helicase family protein [Clostridia bacterium]
MFYKMITKKRDEWFSGECSVKEFISYIESKGQMRDAQIDAIKTYLYLKIACENKPLYQLFSGGYFNTLDLDVLEISSATRETLQKDKSLAALYEYALTSDEEGNIVSDKIIAEIKSNADKIDAKRIFKDIFYGETYTDFLFSLPMGAGKTYLMAAFIYIDLYFAKNEPTNKNFAHNFIVFAPSGLKSSVVPSLRTIQNFDPTWILPEPTASAIKREIKFEILDENKTANKSNKVKNPNVQKIALRQPLKDLFGFVAVTNAEKVILDRVEEKNGQITMFEDSDDEKDKKANELRNIIGKIPYLSVFIDEVHHATDSERKLRAVVNKWAKSDSLNSIIGFSGTPYLQGREKVKITDNLFVASQEISNIVYYYPLIDGIGNFLKKPTVYISDRNERLYIVEKGIRQFLDDYKDTTYSDGTCAKLAIYCGSIETLEQSVYPLVERLVGEYGLEPNESILKYHGGNKSYSMPVDSELEFASLDKPFSKKRIILLVQIGKEGWDCRSLTGIILPQEGDCSTNMVLQTSCRCLRQTTKGNLETAMIYLNKSNADTLNKQLEQQHRINLDQFQKGGNNTPITIKRYDRTKHLKLPKVDFYQLKINYTTVIVNEKKDAAKLIVESTKDAKRSSALITQAEFGQKLVNTNFDTDDKESGTEIANYSVWLNSIIKESFNFISYNDLLPYANELKQVFDKITYLNDDVRYFSSKFDQAKIRATIRKAFYDERSFDTKEELVPEEASLLHVENFTTEIQTYNKADFTPVQETVDKIIADDKGKLKIDSKIANYIKMLESMGDYETAEKWKMNTYSHPMKDKSFHYLPYKTDSSFEIKFLDEILKETIIKENDLEVYYNGDRALTEFKIKCYKNTDGRLRYIGMYTPDFLVINRKDGKIYKALIIETKGKIYANDPAFLDKKAFMPEFVLKNNEKFEYNRFDYLYLEDSLPESERILKTVETVKDFFTER